MCKNVEHMHPLERKSHFANILNAVFGFVCAIVSCILLWLALHPLQPIQTKPQASQGGDVVPQKYIVILAVLLLLAAVILIWKSLQGERRIRRSNLASEPTPQNEPESINSTTSNKQALPLTLPELRPRIIAVRYGRSGSLQAQGLEIVHEGEPAYEVSIPDVKLGTSVVSFEGRIPMMHGRSSAEWRVVITHDHGGVSTGNSLRDEMRRQGIGEIAVPIQYQDGKSLRYISHCRIELDATVPSGLAVHTGREELLGKRTEDAPSMPATAPRPYLEVEDPIGEGFGKTRFVFTNRGGDVAHNVQVQPLSIANTTVVFALIPIIHINESRTTMPTIPGGIGPLHDILRLMEREWDHAFRISGMAGKERVEEWETKLTITYEDFERKRFEATADLICFPIDRNLRDKHAIEQQTRQYKTVEVRNIKFRQVQ